MNLLYKSEKYGWYFDRIQGVGRFERFSDKSISVLETGSDCQDMNEILDTVLTENDQTTAHQIFDEIAETNEFHP